MARLPSCDYSALSTMASSLLRQTAAVSASQNLEPVTAHSDWPLSQLLASSLLPFSGKQPLERLIKLPTDCQQYLRPSFNVPTLHSGKEALTDSDPLRKFTLRDIKAAKFSDAPSYSLPID